MRMWLWGFTGSSLYPMVGTQRLGEWRVGLGYPRWPEHEEEAAVSPGPSGVRLRSCRVSFRVPPRAAPAPVARCPGTPPAAERDGCLLVLVTTSQAH